MATRLPSGKWRAQVLIGTDENGKRIYESFVEDTKDEADFAALTFKLGKGKRVERKEITLRAAMRACIESKRGILSPATIKGYEVIERNFGPYLDTPIMQVNKLNLQTAINQYMYGRNDGKRGTRSPKSVRNAYGFINSVLRQNDIDLGELALPEKQEVEYATPFEAELKQIFEAVKGTNIEIPVLLATFCSLRRSEICGLRFCDIDYETNAIHIDQARLRIDKKEHIKVPKTRKSRRVVFATDYIISLIEALPRESEEEPIFKYTPNMITRRFPTLLKKYGLEHCRFHDLRHSFASVLHERGIDLSYIQAVGGWASDRVLRNSYLQTSVTALRDKSETANGIFSALLEKKKA